MTAAFAEHCFGQIEGFGEYGFPESHAASFALLVYASAWIKCRYPDVFCRRHPQQPADGFLSAGAARARCARSTASKSARPTSISAPGIARWKPPPPFPPPLRGRRTSGHAVRLGFRLIAGLAEDELQKLIAARGNGFSSIERLAAIAGISRFTIERLAEADAFRSLGLDRRAALWAARRLDMIGIRPPRGGAKAQDARRIGAAAADAAFERRAFPGGSRRAPRHAALRACRGRLHRDRAVAESASGAVFPRPPRRARRHTQCRAAQRRRHAGLRRSPSPASFWCGSGRAPRRASCS